MIFSRYWIHSLELTSQQKINLIQIGNVEWNNDYWTLYEIGYLIQCGYATFNDTSEGKVIFILIKILTSLESLFEILSHEVCHYYQNITIHLSNHESLNFYCEKVMKSYED